MPKRSREYGERETLGTGCATRGHRGKAALCSGVLGGGSRESVGCRPAGGLGERRRSPRFCRESLTPERSHAKGVAE